MSVYEFNARDIDGNEVNLREYEGKVLLIVNTASKCGFTPQYEGLEALYKQYEGRGFAVLGFPCNQFAGQEPGDAEQIKSFCSLNYDVTFPLFTKIDVRGESAHPLFRYLTSAAPFTGFDENHPIASRLIGKLHESFPDFLGGDSIKWNFTKFLIGRDGEVVRRFEPTTVPKDLSSEIEKLL